MLPVGVAAEADHPGHVDQQRGQAARMAGTRVQDLLVLLDGGPELLAVPMPILVVEDWLALYVQGCHLRLLDTCKLTLENLSPVGEVQRLLVLQAALTAVALAVESWAQPELVSQLRKLTEGSPSCISAEPVLLKEQIPAGMKILGSAGQWKQRNNRTAPLWGHRSSKRPEVRSL